MKNIESKDHYSAPGLYQRIAKGLEAIGSRVARGSFTPRPSQNRT